MIAPYGILCYTGGRKNGIKELAVRPTGSRTSQDKKLGKEDTWNTQGAVFVVVRRHG